MDLYPAGAVRCTSLSGQHSMAESPEGPDFCVLCGLICDNGMTDGLRYSQSEMPVSKQQAKRARRQLRRAESIREQQTLGLPSKTIQALIERDGDFCFYCSLRFSFGGIRTIDHFIPYSRGGANSMRNYRLACEMCNRSKADHIWVLTGGRWMQLDEDKGTLTIAKINLELPPSQVAG